jgi:hypothetical protein
MESTQATETKEPKEFEVTTSIGRVRIFAGGRSWLNIRSPHGCSPSIMATVEHSGDQWQLDCPPGFSINGEEQPAPPTLADELVTLGRPGRNRIRRNSSARATGSSVPWSNPSARADGPDAHHPPD